MKILIYGTGAVGGYLLALLTKNKLNVSSVSRGETYKTLQSNPLSLNSKTHGSFTIDVLTIDSPENDYPDLIIYCVKSYHNDVAITELKKYVGKDTLILSLQNGFEGIGKLKQTFDSNNVLSGAIYIDVVVQSLGEIVHLGDKARIVMGFEDANIDKNASLTEFSNLFIESGIDLLIPNDIKKELWKKFIGLVSFAGPTTAANLRLNFLLETSLGRNFIQGTLEEAWNVAHALGIDVKKSFIDDTFKKGLMNAEDFLSSMHTDFMKGNPLELNSLNGYIVKLAYELGIQVPINKTICAILESYINGKRKKTIM